MFHHFLSVTAWGQLQIAVPQAQRLNPRGDLERFHDWLTAAKCPKFVLNQNASKYRICPRFHKTQDHRFRHHLFLVSFRKKKVESFPIFPQLFMILLRMTSKHANSFPLQISGTMVLGGHLPKKKSTIIHYFTLHPLIQSTFWKTFSIIWKNHEKLLTDTPQNCSPKCSKGGSTASMTSCSFSKSCRTEDKGWAPSTARCDTKYHTKLALKVALELKKPGLDQNLKQIFKKNMCWWEQSTGFGKTSSESHCPPHPVRF